MNIFSVLGDSTPLGLWSRGLGSEMVPEAADIKVLL